MCILHSQDKRTQNAGESWVEIFFIREALLKIIFLIDILHRVHHKRFFDLKKLIE